MYTITVRQVKLPCMMLGHYFVYLIVEAAGMNIASL